MTREEEIRARLEKATPGPWKQIWGDDDVFMSMCLVVPETCTKSEMAYCSRGEDEYDQSQVIAATLVQSPEYVGVNDGRWQQNAELIANAPSDIDYLLNALEVERSVSKDLLHRGQDIQQENQRLQKELELSKNLHEGRRQTTKHMEELYNKATSENQRLRGALEETREYERIVHAGSKPWSIANKALAGETK